MIQLVVTNLLFHKLLGADIGKLTFYKRTGLTSNSNLTELWSIEVNMTFSIKIKLL